MNEKYSVSRIQLGEDSNWEFKRVVVSGQRVNEPKKPKFADELAAMANGRGGTVLLGVDDESREIFGIPLNDLDTVEGWIREICNDLVRPALDADIRKVQIGASGVQLVPVIRIDVPRSLFVHKSPGGYFRRIGSSKREMSPEMLARLIQERSYGRLIRFDETIVHGTTRSDLDYSLTKRFAMGDPTDDTLHKLRVLATDDDGTDRLTIAGTLLCTSEPQHWLKHAYIQAVSYAGVRADTDCQTDSRDITGPLDRQVAEALRFLQRNMTVRAEKTFVRSDRPQFSERTVFEALVNSVAHRDYSIGGSRIRLLLFKDRLELYVPGALASTLTPDSLHLRQASRNELIVSLLSRCPAPSGLNRSLLMDRRGDGVPIIRAECESLTGYLPDYSLIDEREIRLVIRAAA
ncbi:MAG: putative DNA binding domain-containing protein [Paracoccaceae bacterium]|nr:putative DNA binding domain-containing protein [Paracoccaceae bacterium]